MRAVVFEQFQTFPSLREVEKPTPGPQGSEMMAQMCLHVMCWK